MLAGSAQFTVAGVPCIGLNRGPAFKHNEAFSFQIATDDQQETGRYWNAIVGNGGQESACSWCKDKTGATTAFGYRFIDPTGVEFRCVISAALQAHSSNVS